MLVKNTVIALMAVAPALSIPVSLAVQGTAVASKIVPATKATTGIKATTGMKATTAQMAGGPVREAQNKMNRDIATEKVLKEQLRKVDAGLVGDAASVRGLERAAMKTTPGSKSLSTTHRHHHSSHDKHLSTHRNKQHLRIDTKTDGRVYKHRNSLGTPGSSKLTPGSTRTTGFNTPGSVSASALGTGRSQNFYPGPQTYPQSPMTEDITYTPNRLGGYQERITWRNPGSAQPLARRALTSPGLTTPTTPVTPPLSPLVKVPHKHQTSKSVHPHRHSAVADAMKLPQLLAEARRLVNGLEAQMNESPTVFHDRKLSKHLKLHKTPSTPSTPSTPITPTTPSA